MAKVKIQGHASGTGILTVTAPNTSTDRTITLPDATGTLATTADTFNPDAAVTINESGADVDFRVESDTNTHALFVQGSDGNVGIGTTAPILGKVHLLAAGTSDASLENVAHFGKNSTSRAGLQIRANATQVDVGLQAQAGAGNLDLSFSTLVGGGHYERMRLLSAGGLTFNGDTAASNALDDYEEGEFDASFSSSGASFTYTARKGYYTKIGNRVLFNIYMQLDGSQTLTANQVTITGLPFASNSGAHFNSSSICETRYVNFDSGFTALAGRIGSNTTSILLLEIGDNGAGNVLRSDQLSNSSGQVFISGSYAV